MRCPAFIPVVYPDGRNRRDGGRLVAVAEGYRAWRGLLSSDDAPLVAYLELTIQPLQDFHRRPGIAGAFRRRQQLECPQLVSMSSVTVRTNWPAKMSHSPHGECDIDAKRTDESPGLNSRLAEQIALDQAAELMGVSTRHARRITTPTGRKEQPPWHTATGAANRSTPRPRR